MGLALNEISFEDRFAALDSDQTRFVSKVYSGLTLSLVLATVTCIASISVFKTMPPAEVYGLWRMLGWVELGLILVMSFIRLSGALGWIFLLGFVALTGVTLAPILMIYEKIAGPATVAGALGLTAGIFVTLTAYVRYSGKDFTFLGGFLWMATLGLVLTGLALLFWPNADISYGRACIGALIFCGWILFDTSAVTRMYYRDNNVVGAVLALYLDIINLFMYLLQILGGRRRSD